MVYFILHTNTLLRLSRRLDNGSQVSTQTHNFTRDNTQYAKIKIYMLQ